MLVHINQSLQSLECDIPYDHFRRGSLEIFDQLIHVLVHVLEYKVELVVLLDHFVKVDNIGMMEFY